MNCPNCGKEIDENSAICPFCEKRILSNDSKSILTKELDPDKVMFMIIIGFILIIAIVVLINLDVSFEVYYDIFLVIMLILACFLHKYIKNFVLKISRFLLDITTTFDVLSSILILLIGAFFATELEIPFWWFLLGSIIYALLMLTKDYVLYLIVDIRDSLKKIADKTEDKNGQ